jgi:Zn-dependent alcohol dehydrogenase
VAARISLEQVEEAFEDMNAGRGLRSVIVFDA